MSSMIGGRSGNRGRCAQPCRMEYTLKGENSGENFTITNTYSPETMDISGVKSWVDEDGESSITGSVPDITITLQRTLADNWNDETKIEDVQSVTLTNRKTDYTFENLPKTATTGEEYKYRVKEAPVNGYTPIYNEDFDIVNKYTPGKTEVTVNKSWVNIDLNTDNVPEVTINLYQNGTLYANKVLTKATGYSYKFEELPKYAKTGVEYEYTVQEVLKEGRPIIILEGYEWIREVLSLLAKNINLFESCLVLLENNMEQEAYILARSQFNNTLWISYLCDDHNNERTKEYYYEYHISKLLQFRNIQKYVSENEEKIKNSGAEIIEESEIEEKITQVEALLTSEGYNTEKIYAKSIAKLAKEKQELFGVYISMYCEGSEYEHSNRGKVASFREAILDEYDADAVFKIELGKSDLTTWK